jgi:hypothetical protein
MKATLFTFVAVALLLQTAHAAEKTFELTVQAGKIDRHQSPVCILLPLPAGKVKSVVLKSADGKEIPAQITQTGLVHRDEHDLAKECELHFILSNLKAGESLKLTATLAEGKPDPGIATGLEFTWKNTRNEHLDLFFEDRPVLRYMYYPLDDSTKERREETYKVFHHLYDPAGKRLVTNGGPTGIYPHHRGLFFGFNKITYGDGKKADTWHCTDDAAQTHDKIAPTEAGPVLGRHRVLIAWQGVGKEVFANEERELTVYNIPDGLLVEFASFLKTAKGTVKLDGDPQHAGFHFRADDEVAQHDKKVEKKEAEPETIFIRPDGVGKPGDTRNWDPKTKQGPVDLPWNAMSFVLGGQRYTVAYLDKPTNPKEARFSERAYGRIGSYFEYEVTEKKPLKVNYRIWLQRKQMTVTEGAALDEDFVNPVKVTVK